MTYDKYTMDVILFDKCSVFTDLGVSGDESGGIVVHSTDPTSVDK